MDTSMNLPRVISLYAPVMGSGKSAVASHLCDNYGYSRIKFAGPLKAMATTVLAEMGHDPHIIDRMLEGDLKEVPLPGFEKSTPRSLMQTLGTDWGREAIDGGLWINLAMRKTERIVRNGGRVVIDDTRFPNEIASLRQFWNESLFSMCVVRPAAGTAESDGRYEGLLKDEHFDVKILNDDTLDVLQQAVDFSLTARF